jgi:beta-lactamase regulating signal transducer with metallopeptidase domain/stalled ribosome alternative rescue factor ArfA
MSPDALSTYLINAVWQAPLVAFTALMIARFAGLAPAGRNRVWLTALAAAALLPAVSLDGLLQATPTVVRIAPTTVVESPTAVTAEPLMATPAIALAPSAAWIMVGLAAAFAVLAVVRLALAGVAASRLAATGRPAVLPGDVVRAVERLAASRHRKPPPILATPAVEGPAVVGAWRPVILIPAQFDVSPDDLRAALLHEMAHVLRHDYAVNLACEILTLPLAWHPAVAAIKAGVRRSRELACDAMAAQAMASQKAYARSLLSLARTLGAGAIHTQTALAVGLIGRSDLEDRLMHLIKPRDAEGLLVKTARACGLAVVSASLLGSAALLHVTPVFAQTPKAAPAPSPVAVAPLPPPSTPANVAQQAQTDAAALPALRRRHGTVIHKDGVLIEAGQTGRRHSWTAADGTAMSVVTPDDGEPTLEQKRKWEADARDAEAKAAKVDAYVNSPEFKVKIEKAKEAGKRAEAMVNSPEFKAKIEKAKAAGEAARAYTNSPEFKAAIARAQSQAAEAAAEAVNSPEFRRQMRELRRLGPDIDREINREVERELSRGAY